MTRPISRRRAAQVLMAVGAAWPVAASARQATPIAATPEAGGGSLAHRGILYDVGTRVSPDFTTRPDSHRAYLASELATIRDDLHCTTVCIFGGDTDRLAEGARAAFEAGLQVRLQPRLVDASPDDMLGQVAEAARMSEDLRASGAEVVLDVGCELTLLGAGIVPGETFAERFAYFMEHLDEIPAFSEELNVLLTDVVADARSAFGGRITYASGAWEAVDWAGFDIVGVDLYRDYTNADGYADLLRSYHQVGKPLWITEFGSCTYEGADELGGSGFDIIDWTTNPPQIAGDVIRSEQVQAEYITNLLDIHAREGVDGSFVYQFIEPHLTHDPDDPAFDLDMASYGVVKTFPADSANSYETSGYWEPKEAFGAVAEFYGALAGPPTATPVTTVHSSL